MNPKPASESPAILVLHGDDGFMSPARSAVVVYGLHGALLLLVGFWWIGGLFIGFWSRWRKARHWSHRPVLDSESGRLPDPPESG